MAKNRDNPVVLSRIYTRTGDDGTTALGDTSRTRKTDPRLAAYADVEEANAAIGTAIALGDLPENVVALLTRVQNDLFDVGADLCAPVVPDPEYPPLRVEPPYIERLEAACDEHNETLEPLRSFILPGGTPGAALLHVARTVARRAERSAWAAVEAHGAAAVGDPAAAEGGVNPLTATYLNRLSDLLFILCRVANAEHGDVLWKPGGER
ncbi:cob(I)yrinic acid a,c-diamide adenosyltransferase [Actinomadura sp. 6K520]|uniref:cob(I)yrinic acid a,c-diamide adenosyltransferase n=1 Tax=Actinomadura sp. 6K520 TaxID=2530364 RepID=UPI0010509D63|nr:cob(I)yrinic acid a,c-diamide adenosyltransferase [Actinomadura sp. 6K520]TDE30170.1 cob(I)yrinic acid a,c-diamide adenosyltransferase [Actinomadura sp. 6K520]